MLSCLALFWGLNYSSRDDGTLNTYDSFSIVLTELIDDDNRYIKFNKTRKEKNVNKLECEKIHGPKSSHFIT